VEKKQKHKDTGILKVERRVEKEVDKMARLLNCSVVGNLDI